MDSDGLYNLIEMRKSILEQHSSKKEEIANKLDELILIALNKLTPPQDKA